MYTKEKETEQTSVSHVNRGNTRASCGLLMPQQLMLHAMKVLHLSKNLILPINPIPYPSALETYRTIHEKELAFTTGPRDEPCTTATAIFKETNVSTRHPMNTATTSYQEERQGSTEPQQSDVVAHPLESQAS